LYDVREAKGKLPGPGPLFGPVAAGGAPAGFATARRGLEIMQRVIPEIIRVKLIPEEAGAISILPVVLREMPFEELLE